MRIRAIFNRAIFLVIFSLLVGATPALAQGGPGAAPPVADAGLDRTVAVGDVVVLDGSGSTDPKEMTADFEWFFFSIPAGSTAQLSAPHAVEPRFSVKPSFVADKPGQYIVKLRLTEGNRVSEIDEVIISASDSTSTVNSAPRADAGPGQAATLGSLAPVVLDGSGSTDPDGDSLTFSWTLVQTPAGSNVSLDDPTSVTPRFIVNLGGTYIAELTVDDGPEGHSSVDRVTISTGNVPPVAVAGPDITATLGDKVQFDGSLSHDRNGDQLAYSWALISVPVIPFNSAQELASPNDVRSTLVVDKEGIFLVQLTVTDSNGAVSRDTLTVSTVNAPPLANAGPDQVVQPGDTVELDAGRTTDWDGDLLGFRWALVSRPAGSGATLADPASARQKFTADLAGTYVAQLFVGDGSEQGAPDTVVVTTGNALPVADAGPPQTVSTSQVVQLDALTGTRDANLADTLTYSWTVLEQPNGNRAVFSDRTSPTPTFTFTKFGEHVLQVTVSDGERSRADTILLTTINSRPFASAGAERLAAPGDLIDLTADGSGDVDNDPLAYRWAIIARPGSSTAALDDPASRTPSFTADAEGYYLVQLIVLEASVTNPLTIPKSSLPATLVVDAPDPPVAVAGLADPGQTPLVDDVIGLTGANSSDPQGDPLTFDWSLVSRPAGSTAALTGATTVAPEFTPDVFGDYVVQLVVNDGVVDSAPGTLTVSTVNRAPVAEAGAEQTVTAGAVVQLDGSASSDLDRQALTHAWRFTAKPAASLAVLSDATIVNPTFTADVEGLYVAELVVNDGISDSAPDTVGVRAGSGVVNTAPVLDPVGPQTVELGSALAFTLGATDADGDPFGFFATPLPLPAGASLDAATGAFSFRPDETQIGVHTITFGVSDGLASDSESVPITVTAPPVGTVTTLTGRLVDAEATSQGVAGATVSVVGSGVSAITAADGSFTLANLGVTGDQVLEIDATTAVAAPDGSPYASRREGVTLIADAINNLAPFAVARIDLASQTVYNPAGTTTVINTALNTTVTVVGGSATNADGTAFAGTFTISDIPTDEILALLPAYISPCNVITFQSDPAGVIFSPGASVTLGNPDNLPPGSVVDIWGIPPTTGQFILAGTGTVSVDGLSIATSSLIGATPAVFFAVPRPPVVVAAIDMNGFNRRPTLLGDGNLSQALTLPTYRSLGQDRGLDFVYNTATADPRPVVAAEVTFPANSGMPPSLEGRLLVGGVEVAGPVFTSTAGYTDPDTGVVRPALVAGQPIRQALQFDASSLPTGGYPYRYVASSKYSCSKVGAETGGHVLVENRSDSPLGKGWSLDGLQRLHPQAGGRVLLTAGDGGAKLFRLPAVPVSVSGDAVELADPPRSVAAGALESDTAISVFGEATNLPLPQDIRVNATAPFPFDSAVPTAEAYDNLNDLQNPTIPAGAIVNSHFVHFDATGSTGDVTRTASITFESEILGVILLDADLDASDAALGAPETAYSAGGGRGVEFASGDRITISPDLRTLTVIHRSLGEPDQLRVITAGAIRQELVASRFDTDAEGWQITGARFSPNPVYSSTGGNPGGHIRGRDTPNPMVWIAPAKFLGDQSAAYNGLFTFDNWIQTNESSNQDQRGRGFAVTLTGAGVTLAFNPYYYPHNLLWSRFALLLNERAGWRDQATGLPPTRAQMQAVLANLTDIRISGETIFNTFFGSFEITHLDNVVLYQLDGQPLLAGDHSAPPGDFSNLVCQADGSCTRTLKDGTAFSFDADGLQTAVTDSNGMATLYTYDAEGRLTGVADPVDPTRVTTLAYDANGNLTSVTDPAGRVTEYALDPFGNLIEVVMPDESVLRFAYDANSRLLEAATARGFVTTHDYGFAGQWIGSGFPDGTSISASISGSLGLSDFDSGLGTETSPDTYVLPEDRITTLQDARLNKYVTEVNEFGALIRVTDPIGRETSFVRDADNLVRESVRDNDGLLPDGTAPATVVTALDYDGRGNVIARTEAAGTALERTTRFEYEPVFNKVVKITDPSNSDPSPLCGAAGVTCFEYDPNGNSTATTDSAGVRAARQYAHPVCLGMVTRTTNAEGLAEEAITQFVYDPATCLIAAIIDPENSQTNFSVDSAGNVAVVTEGFGTPAARTTSSVYDVMNRLLSETDPQGGVSETRYDADGNVIAEIDETGIAAASTYDVMGRVKTETHPATGTVMRVYDENGNMKSLIDPTGKIVHFQYDAVNRADRTEDPAAGIRLFAYDLLDNPKRVTDANGYVTTFKYDVHGREVERRNALGDTWTFAYDSRDNMVNTVDAVGQTITKTFDELNRLTGMELIEADGFTTEDTVTFTYDALGLKRTAVDGDSSLAWTYDGANRVATAETVAGLLTVQPAVLLTHAYDAVGERAGLTHGPDGIIVDGAWSYLHDGAGNLTRMERPAGDGIDLVYDAASRLARITSANTVEMTVLYEATTGRPGSIAHSLGAATLASFGYGFDTDGKILSIADNGGTRNFTYDATLQVTGGGYASAPESYSYDPEGNRTTSHLSASYSHDTANRLREDIETCYDYDANGNLATRTAKVAGACTGDATAYEWDVLNRLVRIDNPDATYAAYRYDAQGRRIEKDVNGSLTRYVYDDDAILLEFDGANSLQARYSHGEEVDQPLAMTRGADSYFYHTDHLGSVRLLTDAAGAVANAYDYDAFGNLEATSFETVANPYAFTARERDPESGLMFYRARYYDPRIGRFISEDPIGFAGEDLNLYRYVFNGSVNMIDPNGNSIFSYLFSVKTELRLAIGFVALKIVIPRIVKNALTKAVAFFKFLRDNAAAAAILGGAGAGVAAVIPAVEPFCATLAAGVGGAVGAYSAIAAGGGTGSTKPAAYGALGFGISTLLTYLTCTFLGATQQVPL